MRAPLITAIMPARNTSRTIASAIASVRAQDFRDWELVVRDDGSTDETFAIALHAADGDPRIIVQRGPFLGRGAARNACLVGARGLFVAICDSDDVSLPQRFSRQVAAIEHPSPVDCVSCARVVCFSGDGLHAFAVTAPRGEADIRASLNRGRMPILFASAMLRRTLIDAAGGFDEQLRRNQDFGLLLRSPSARYRTLEDSLILYRTSSLAASWPQVAENNFYRSLALRRATGQGPTADAFRRSPAGRLLRYGVIPAQYLWFQLKRRFLRLDVQPLVPAESHLLVGMLREMTVGTPRL